MKALWWVGFVVTVALAVLGVARLEYGAWVSGGIASGAAIILAVFYRMTADRMMGVTTRT